MGIIGYMEVVMEFVKIILTSLLSVVALFIIAKIISYNSHSKRTLFR